MCSESPAFCCLHKQKERASMDNGPFNQNSKKRPWILVAAWFGTIALIGVLKRTLDRQRQS
jgi:hypothetical protein